MSDELAWTKPAGAGEQAAALGRKAWLFCGSDRGGDRAAAMYSLIVTAKLNDVDPRAWLADVLRRIAGHPASRLRELLPWNWESRPPNWRHEPSQQGLGNGDPGQPEVGAKQFQPDLQCMENSSPF